MTARHFLPKVMLVASILFFYATTYSTAADTRIETSLADGGKAAIIFADSPLKTMTETPFFIELQNESGKLIMDAKLTLSLTMPFMPMPPNHPQATWQEEAYNGVVIFTMTGAWQVNVNIDRPDTATEKIIFDIEMVVMK